MKNESAFPVLPPAGEQGAPPPGYPWPAAGMTLLDWFAGMALAGWMANPDNTGDDPDVSADDCYDRAEGMLRERERRAG